VIRLVNLSPPVRGGRHVNVSPRRPRTRTIYKEQCIFIERSMLAADTFFRGTVLAGCGTVTHQPSRHGGVLLVDISGRKGTCIRICAPRQVAFHGTRARQ
jgi:hypothetical protein